MSQQCGILSWTCLALISGFTISQLRDLDSLSYVILNESITMDSVLQFLCDMEIVVSTSQGTMQVKRENTNKALAIIIIVFSITATASLHFPSSTTSSVILIKWTECYETQFNVTIKDTAFMSGSVYYEMPCFNRLHV